MDSLRRAVKHLCQDWRGPALPGSRHQKNRFVALPCRFVSLGFGSHCHDSSSLLIKMLIFQNVRHREHFSKARYFLLAPAWGYSWHYPAGEDGLSLSRKPSSAWRLRRPNDFRAMGAVRLSSLCLAQAGLMLQPPLALLPAAGKVIQVHEGSWGPAEGYPPVLFPRRQGLDSGPAVYQVRAGLSPPPTPTPPRLKWELERGRQWQTPYVSQSYWWVILTDSSV